MDITQNDYEPRDAEDLPLPENNDSASSIPNDSSTDPVPSENSDPSEILIPVQNESTEPDQAPAAPQEDAQGQNEEVSLSQEEFDALRALTSLIIGGAIEGTSQLVSRLQDYERRIREEQENNQGLEPSDPAQEDEMDRLRFALFGLALDAQSTLRRNISLWARALDKSAAITGQVARPVTNSFLFAPLQRRIDSLAKKGEQSLARWIEEGRKAEPYSRQMAKMTYNQIVNEFINQLSENPEIQGLVTQQSMSLAGEARDEVRERTVTADNVMEGIVRRILRRAPRKELPSPPPEVQRWASITLDEYKIEASPEETDS